LRSVFLAAFFAFTNSKQRGKMGAIKSTGVLSAGKRDHDSERLIQKHRHDETARILCLYVL